MPSDTQFKVADAVNENPDSGINKNSNITYNLLIIML